MRKSTKIFAALAVAGVAALSGSAFTAGGVTDSSGDGFVGGKVTQSITGAVVTNVEYTLDSTNTNITGVEIATKAGETVSIAFAGGTTNSATWSCAEGTAGIYTCTATGTQSVNATSLTINVV